MPVLDNIFEVFYLVGVLVGSVIRKLYTGGLFREEKMKMFKGGDGLLLILVSIGMFAIPLFYIFTTKLDFADYYLPSIAGWLGAVVFAVALWLFWRSHVDLGQNWSLIAEIRDGQTLITNGVFRRIRHPMYAAHLLWAIAQSLLLHNWIAGPAFLVTFFPLYLHRIPREEEMMIKEFGDEYREYMKRTGRIIPRLW